ncbi:MAG: hypothetical protein ACKOA1_01345 [Bacteroidota bacterium]
MKKEIGHASYEAIVSLFKELTPPFVVASESANAIEIIGNTPALYGSTKKTIPGMYFASLVVRKDALSLHFFPIYVEPSLTEGIPDSLLSKLTGKTCFTFKKNHDIDLKSLKKLLKKGAVLWKKKGYLK